MRRTNPARVHRFSSSTMKAPSLEPVVQGRHRRRGRPHGFSHWRSPNSRARRTQREAPISCQAAADSRTRWSGGEPAPKSSLCVASPAPRLWAAEGAGQAPGAIGALRLGGARRIPATLLAPPPNATLPAALLGGLDLVRGGSLVEGEVAEGDRLGMEGAPGLGGVGVRRRQQALLQLGSDRPVHIRADVVAVGAQLRELVAEDPAA